MIYGDYVKKSYIWKVMCAPSVKENKVFFPENTCGCVLIFNCSLYISFNKKDGVMYVSMVELKVTF